MTGRTPNAYFESAVLSADPVELTGMLYEAAVAAVEDARRHLAAGDIASRSRAITRAHEIVLELLASLNFEAGGEFSQRMALLYEYIMRLLVDANVRQADPPLAEAHKLLSTVASGWREMQALRNASAAEPESPAVAPEEPEPVGSSAWQSGYASDPYSGNHSWSL